MRHVGLCVLAVLATPWLVASFVPPPRDAGPESGGGKGDGKRVLADGWEYEDAEELHHQRRLYVVVDQESSEPQATHDMVSEGLPHAAAEEKMVRLDHAPSSNVLEPFPGLSSKGLQSGQLAALGHNNVLSRLVALAEFGEAEQRDSADHGELTDVFKNIATHEDNAQAAPARPDASSAEGVAKGKGLRGKERA